MPEVWKTLKWRKMVQWKVAKAYLLFSAQWPSHTFLQGQSQICELEAGAPTQFYGHPRDVLRLSPYPRIGTLLDLGQKRTNFSWAMGLSPNRRSHSCSHRKYDTVEIVLCENARGQECPARTLFCEEPEPLGQGLCFAGPPGSQSTWNHHRVCVEQASCRRQSADTPWVPEPPVSWWWSEHQEGTNLKTKQCGNCPWSPGCLALEGRCFRLAGPGSDED